MGRLVTLGQTVKPFDKSLVDIYVPNNKLLFPDYFRSILNPWSLWQLGDGPPIAADSASPTTLGQGGGSWSEFPFPPPNPLSWGSTVSKVAGLLNDSRSAAMTAVGVTASPCSLSWSAGADAPWWPPGPEGTWIFFTLQRIATPTVSNKLIEIAGEIGLTTEIWTDNIRWGDIAIWASPGHTGSQAITWDTGALMPVGKKSQVVILFTNGSTSQFTAQLWIDGVDLGAKTVGGGTNLATGFLSEGITIGRADGIAFEDVAVSSADVSAGNHMNNTVVSELYSHWAAWL